jgi:hypothetical protein
MVLGCAVLARPSLAGANDARMTLSGAIPLVPVSVGGGVPVLFVLDTGAAASVVDQTLSAQLGLDRFLPKTGPVRAPDTGLNVAGLTSFVRPAIADMSPIAKALGQPVLGLLGSDFLSAFQVVADFAAQRLVLNPAKQPMPSNGIPMRFAGIPYVSAEVRHGNSSLHGEFGLDTGLDTGVKIKETATTPMMRLATKPGTTLTMEGVKPVQTGVVDALRIGGLDVVILSAIVTQHDPPIGAGPTYVGMIGAPAFTHRRLTLDYQGGWCAVSPVIL